MTFMRGISSIFFDLSSKILCFCDQFRRFEETNDNSNGCKAGEKCIGGLARAVHVIRSLLEARKNSNPLYLNAGDNFQGTLWYNIGRWNVTSQFLNMLRADAMVISCDSHYNTASQKKMSNSTILRVLF